jgi:hypothetical protein
MTIWIRKGLDPQYVLEMLRGSSFGLRQLHDYILDETGRDVSIEEIQQIVVPLLTWSQSPSGRVAEGFFTYRIVLDPPRVILYISQGTHQFNIEVYSSLEVAQDRAQDLEDSSVTNEVRLSRLLSELNRI